MWFSKKGHLHENYKPGFAYSSDGHNWIRDDKLINLKVGPSKFDDKMICYQYVFEYKNEYYSLYNGNVYGRDGIGLAKLQNEK